METVQRLIQAVNRVTEQVDAIAPGKEVPVIQLPQKKEA